MAVKDRQTLNRGSLKYRLDCSFRVKSPNPPGTQMPQTKPDVSNTATPVASMVGITYIHIDIDQI